MLNGPTDGDVVRGIPVFSGFPGAHYARPGRVPLPSPRTVAPRPLLARPSRGNDRPGRPDRLPPAEGLVLGALGRDRIAVRSLPTHRELGGVFVVGRAAKALLAGTYSLAA
jgi:hypothetical protein